MTDLAAHPLPLMTGYLGDEARNTDAMAGGFYHTGDVAAIDDEGYISYIGRTDDVFKASDYRISPFELESVLIEHPAVTEVAIVPSPDPVRLAVPKAFVTLNEGFETDGATLKDWLNPQLGKHERVCDVEVRLNLPRTLVGKLSRKELRDAYTRGPVGYE